MNVIVLDRDGIINKLLVDSNGNTDSPMNISQVEVFHWIPTALKQLNDLDFALVIATNQPAAAKGKVSYDDLRDAHNYIVEQAVSAGAQILKSYICWHRKEDNCICRKPKTALLQNAFNDYPEFIPDGSWMVGDRATDIIAGINFKLQTAWLGSPISDDEEQLSKVNMTPTYRGKDLRDFVTKIIEKQ